MSNIAASASLNPFTLPAPTAPPQPAMDYLTKRGGFDQIGTASPANGGGPVYVFESDGAFAQFDKHGHGTMVAKPAQWDDTFQIRHNLGSAQYHVTPGYDWIKDTGGNPPGFFYSCQELNPTGA